MRPRNRGVASGRMSETNVLSAPPLLAAFDSPFPPSTLAALMVLFLSSRSDIARLWLTRGRPIRIGCAHWNQRVLLRALFERPVHFQHGADDPRVEDRF